MFSSWFFFLVSNTTRFQATTFKKTRWNSMLQKLTIVLSVKLWRWPFRRFGEIPLKTFATNSDSSSLKGKKQNLFGFRERGDKVRLKELSKRISSLSQQNPGGLCLGCFSWFVTFSWAYTNRFHFMDCGGMFFSGSACPDLIIRVIYYQFMNGQWSI